MITKEGLQQLKEKILSERKPVETFIRVRMENGEIVKIPVVIIINSKAKPKYMKEAVPITVSEIWEEIKDKETFQEQQKAIGRYIIKAKEFYDSVVKAKEIFSGKIVDIK